jgi:acyl-CoA reductase-like NAD-dependent aldehyde dehydrogenase
MAMTTTKNSNTDSTARASASDEAQSTNAARELTEVHARQRDAFDRNRASSLQQRRAILLKLERLVEQNRLILAEAANADFGTRAGFETELSEVIATISSIRFMRRRLRSWMSARRRSVSIWYMPAKNRVEPRPLGVVGVVSPWNFPLNLALVPAATALAAGNRVMLKVSEFTPHTSAVLKRLIEENFSPER